MRAVPVDNSNGVGGVAGGVEDLQEVLRKLTFATGRSDKDGASTAAAAASSRSLFREAFGEASNQNTVDSNVFDGPTSLVELGRTIADSEVEPPAYYQMWIAHSGIAPKSTLAIEMLVQLRTLWYMFTHDLVNGTTLVCAEHVARRVMMIMKAEQKSKFARLWRPRTWSIYQTLEGLLARPTPTVTLYEITDSPARRRRRPKTRGRPGPTTGPTTPDRRPKRRPRQMAARARGASSLLRSPLTRGADLRRSALRLPPLVADGALSLFYGTLQPDGVLTPSLSSSSSTPLTHFSLGETASAGPYSFTLFPLPVGEPLASGKTSSATGPSYAGPHNRGMLRYFDLREPREGGTDAVFDTPTPTLT